jgi:hypothetical protein
VDFLEGDTRVTNSSKTDYGLESDMGTTRVQWLQVSSPKAAWCSHGNYESASGADSVHIEAVGWHRGNMLLGTGPTTGPRDGELG